MPDRVSRSLLLLAGLTALAATVRFATLGVQSFWYDEALTADVLQPSLFDTLDSMADREANPPVYFVVAWLWTRVLGEGDVALRSLSALAGTLTVPVAYAAAKELVSERAGLITAGLVASSPFLIWYSQEARAYALATLVAAAALLFFARALRADAASRRDVALWGVASALAIATHYFAAFPFLIEAAVLLARLGRRRDLLTAAGAAGAVGALLIPLARHQESDGQVDWISAEPLSGRITQAAKAFVSGTTGTPGRGLGLLAAALATVGAAILLARARRSESRGALLALGIVAVGIAASLACAAVGVDFFYYRNLIVLWVPLAVAVAAGQAAAGRAGLVLAVALAAVLLAIHVRILGAEDHQRPDWESALAAIGEPAGERGFIASPRHAWILGDHYGRDLRHVDGRKVAVTELAVIAENRDPGFVEGEAWFGFRVAEARKEQHMYVALLRSEKPLAVRTGRIPGHLLGGSDGELFIESE